MLAFAWLWEPMPADHPARSTAGTACWCCRSSSALVYGLRIGPWIELLLFGGNTRTWMLDNLGLGYDQRNALVVGSPWASR
jgi:phosphate transport system permease protein